MFEFVGVWGGGGSAYSKGSSATSEHAQKHCAAILLFEPRPSALGSLECHEQFVGLVFWGMESSGQRCDTVSLDV
jgi:hypothetical protein